MINLNAWNTATLRRLVRSAYGTTPRHSRTACLPLRVMVPLTYNRLRRNTKNGARRHHLNSLKNVYTSKKPRTTKVINSDRSNVMGFYLRWKSRSTSIFNRQPTIAVTNPFRNYRLFVQGDSPVQESEFFPT